MDLQLNASRLGTKEYWDSFYLREIANFAQNADDSGECWFDDSDAEAKIVEFVVERLGTLRLFLDLGTGNGHLLFELAAAIAAPGRTYTGVDYSPESVAFARTLARDRDGAFAFEQVDLLADGAFLSRTFDVLLDKGTLDAIALNPHPLANGRTGMEAYAPQVRRMMHRGLTLLVTSCNFTAPELERLICADTDLEAFDRIAYPSFRFGGVQGTTICSIAFRVRGNVQA